MKLTVPVLVAGVLGCAIGVGGYTFVYAMDALARSINFTRQGQIAVRDAAQAGR